jgi:nitroreductase
MFSDLVLKNRTCRSFDQSEPISEELMLKLVDLARVTASGMNRQPLRYRVLSSKTDIEKMMANSRFGTALKDVKLPPEGMEPTGFILMFVDTEAASPSSLALKDVGIAAQTILLGATEAGFAGCMLGSFNPKTLCEDFNVPARYVPELAIALGKSAERAELVAENGSLTYYRDENNTHFVPKRKLPDILI